MDKVEILTEEPSMKEVLEIILPKILPEKWILNQNYFIRAHRGKSDLQNSIPHKIKAFSPLGNVGIVILHDQDSHHCILLKENLQKLCTDNGNCPILIRIICRELESWYLGDLEAIEKAYPHFKASKHKNKAKYRLPDNLMNASEEIKKLVPEFQKINGARKIAPHLNIDKPDSNLSESFRQFITGIHRFFCQ